MAKSLRFLNISLAYKRMGMLSIHDRWLWRGEIMPALTVRIGWGHHTSGYPRNDAAWGMPTAKV
jgi:hypothetical protein